jgi:hypothetical protein
MFEEEAELGSDNEDKDNFKKAINKEDAEENEEGLDSDLEGFVVHNEDEEIGDAEDGAYEKYRLDMELDDQRRK